MRNVQAAVMGSVSHYRPGEPLLETDRVGGVEVTYVHEGGDPDIGLLDIVKPEPHDYPALKKALKFLKYTDEEAEALYNLIGGTITTVAGIVSIVGAVGAIADLLDKMGLFGPNEDKNEVLLRHIGLRVEQIYGYLKAEERRGLYKEAIDWRTRTAAARGERANVRVSRAPEILNALRARADDLDKAILTMLDKGTGRIAFVRSVYGYAPNTFHWIEGAATPFMTQANGGAVNYADPAQDLQGEIWDPGHYLDVLLDALRERIAVAVAIEPAFRSTGYDREKLAGIAKGLADFVDLWRGSIIVANPAVGINNGNQLQNPFESTGDGPMGILVGAVDPISGISAIHPVFGDFPIIATRNYLPWEAWGGVYDETRAKDPAGALAAAMDLQFTLVDQVVRGCGLERLQKLQWRMLSVASPPMGSDFVRLRDATFLRIEGPALAGQETIDLGHLKVFAADPNKTYVARRYLQVTEKTFRIRMARRADVSRVQLGYRLRIGDHDIELCPFSTAAFEGGAAAAFPSVPIHQTFTLQLFVYDCCQSRPFSVAEEDRFERDGKVPGGQRVFLNERVGGARISVDVNFVPTVSDGAGPYAGEAIVAVRNIDPATYPDAFILEVTVLETHIGADLAPVEVHADGMSIHMMPSYLELELGSDFFSDLQEARARMAQTAKGIRDRVPQEPLPQPRRPDPDPRWRMRRMAADISEAVSFVEAALERNPEAVREQIARFRPPQIRDR